MHQRIAHPPVSPDSATSGPASIIDSLSDTLLNAFTKVRKPDERFLEVRDNLDKFEESLVAIERTEARARTRIGGERDIGGLSYAFDTRHIIASTLKMREDGH